MWPLELVATATASPRYSPAGSFRKFGTVINGISGTFWIVALRCANAGASTNTERATGEMKIRFIEVSCIIQRHCMRSAGRLVCGMATDAIGGSSMIVGNPYGGRVRREPEP